MLSVTFDRTSLGLEPLVITSDPEAGVFYLTEKDCGWPQFTMRRTYSPDSEVISGRRLLAATSEQGTLPLGIGVHGDQLSDVLAAMDELTDATTQFSYDLTLVVDGVTIGTYSAQPEYPNWGSLDSGFVRANRNEGTVTIPINPPGSA